jgi:hypothetical protein
MAVKWVFIDQMKSEGIKRNHKWSSKSMNAHELRNHVNKIKCYFFQMKVIDSLNQLCLLFWQ